MESSSISDNIPFVVVIVVLVELADELSVGRVAVEEQIKDPGGSQADDEEQVFSEEEARRRQVGLFVETL